MVPPLPPAPGLQPERTLFAWRRTVVSLALATGLVAFCVVRVEPGLAVGLLALVGVGVAVVALVRLLAEQHDPRRSTEPWPRLLHGVTAVVALAVVGAACAVVEAAGP